MNYHRLDNIRTANNLEKTFRVQVGDRVRVPTMAMGRETLTVARVSEGLTADDILRLCVVPSQPPEEGTVPCLTANDAVLRGVFPPRVNR